jgi:hypothetical protein
LTAPFRLGEDMSDIRLHEIKAALLAALPKGGNALHEEEIQRLAQLRLVAEGLRGKAIAGRRVDLERLVRIEGLINRIAKQLVRLGSRAARRGS